MKTTLCRILLCLIILSASHRAFSQESVFNYLTQEEGATLTLELNLDDLLKNRKNREYIPAQLSDAAGKVFPLEVRTRGKFRRTRCEIPPVKLKFQKDSLVLDQMGKSNEIKLVLPCVDRTESEEWIIREYVAYRMYELLSPGYCTRARLVRLQLKDVRKKRPKKMFALLVEHEEEVSHRQNCSVVLDWGIKPAQMDADRTALMVLFQYMIGNTDWEIVSSRNVMLLQPTDSTEKILPVPYDFDFSGLVSASYASPSSESGVLTVRDRYLMADGLDPAALKNAKAKILQAKSELYQWCANPFLSKASRADMVFFMDAFFNMLENEAEIPPKLMISKE